MAQYMYATQALGILGQLSLDSIRQSIYRGRKTQAQVMVVSASVYDGAGADVYTATMTSATAFR